jgi:hypothetical protein
MKTVRYQISDILYGYQRCQFVALICSAQVLRTQKLMEKRKNSDCHSNKTEMNIQKSDKFVVLIDRLVQHNICYVCEQVDACVCVCCGP